jgi:hypothetical protein
MTEPTRSQHARASVDPTVDVYAGDAPVVLRGDIPRIWLDHGQARSRFIGAGA